MRINGGVVPNSGWHFPAGKNGTRPILNGSDFDDVVRLLTNYRVDNGIPLGNPANDITEYLCNRQPGFCSGGGATQYAIAPTDQPTVVPTSYLQRVLNWISLRYQHAGSYTLATKSEAERRAAICARCPQNQEWRAGCPPCVSKAERDLLLIRQNHTTDHHRRLLGCRAAGHDNATAVFLPEKLLRHRKHYKLPSNCWMLNLKKSNE